ncbi:MAG: NAD(P)/FAD-dependent oxidoreductase [Vicinamibacteria bacterium]|nr:NAD(P)/FAD-dependent oxidoreductase [Vicinamibacteria bacterium]
MEDKKVLIVGGGIAGLCTGVYLRRHGFDTEILEMHTISGGLATAWKKDGFTFENCIHWLVGSKDGKWLNAAWKEVFDIGRLEFFEDPVFQVIERGGERITIYRNPDRLEAELLAKATQDVAAVREFAGLIRKIAKLHMPEGGTFLQNLGAYLKLVPCLPMLFKYGKLSMADYSKRFTNPILREFFSGGISDLSFLAIVFSLAWMAQGNAGYPIGGSLRMIGLIEDNYKKLGGRIRFKARVKRILAENGRAVGVVLENGEELRADVVVSAADGHATIFDMLEGLFADDGIRRIYETYKPFPSYVQVSFGVGADLREEPGHITLLVDKDIEIDPGTTENIVAFRVFHFDPTFAPPGKTAVVCFLATYNHEYWCALREKDATRYEAEKQRVAAAVTAVFEGRFPKARGKIEVVDVATPATVVRYTGNWRGSMEGWLYTPATGIRQLPCVLPGLRSFYMVGQWISPGGGLPAGLMTARRVSKRIAKDAGIRWELS